MAVLDPEVDPDNIIALGERRAIGQAVQSAEDSPDDAVRAMELSDATGVHPALVYGDLDNFEQQHKIQLGANIVRSNRFIQDYVNSHPLAAKVSNDDYGQLDKVSEAVGKYTNVLGVGYAPDVDTLKLAHNFMLGFGEAPIGAWGAQNEQSREFIRQYPYSAALAGIEGLGLELPARVLSGVTSMIFGPEKAQALMDPGMIASLQGIGPAGAIPEAVAALIRSARAGSPWFERGRMPPVGVDEHLNDLHVQLAKDDAKALSDALKEVSKSATHERRPELFASFLRNHPGADGDIGISADAVRALYGMDTVEKTRPLLDQMRQLESDMGDLVERSQVAVETHGRESPEATAAFDAVDRNRQAQAKANEEFRKISETKAAAIAPGDNLLGFVPDLADQLTRAEATGGDIKVNKADYLAKVEPEVHKAIEDHIRSRPEGLTVEEGKGLPPIEAYHGSPHEFDAFDLSKIGTGEGAQSYGHGLYFAEAPEVAGSYRPRALGDAPRWMIGKEEVSLDGLQGIGALENAGTPKAYAAVLLEQSKGDIDAAIASAKKQKGELHYPEGIEKLEQAKQSGSFQRVEGPKGQLYRVHIHANKEDFLDWDKPLAEQGIDYEKINQRVAPNQPALPNMTGEEVHRALRIITGSDQAVAKTLAEAGIPGIKYLDQGSRDLTAIKADLEAAIIESKTAIGLRKGEIDRQIQILEQKVAKQPTSNFVLFDPSLVEITHRNGDAVRSLRQAAGLQGIQERKLTLQRLEDNTYETPELKYEFSKEAQAYNLMDAQGKSLGYISIGVEKGGKRLFVDDISAELGPQSMGPKAMRDVLQQLKELYPEAETLEGMRVSGAREKANKENVKTSIDLTKIKPRQPKQLELPAEGTTRIEDQQPFTPAPPGFTIEQYKLYLKNIAKRQAQDVEAANARIMKEQRKRQGVEWKENEVKLRPKVVEDVNSRPNIVADDALRGGKVKIHPDSLSPEQRAALPKEYLGKEGLTADQAATRYGFATGDQMVEAVSRLNEVRKKSGMRDIDFRRRLIDIELNRQMEEKYRKLEENVLKEAKDQVLSEVQEEMLHQQTMRYAELAGEQYPIRKEPTIAAMREDVDKTPIGQISSDELLADSGRAGRAMELAATKEDWAETFRQSQLQKNSILKAKMALEREERIEKFGKLLKKFSKRDPDGVATEHTNFIHQIMDKIGVLSLRTRSLVDLNEEIARKGYPDLATFVSSRKDATFGMDQMPIADFLMDEKWKKPLKNLTGAEFDQVHDSVATLAKMGADEKKLIDRGNAWDLQTQVIDPIKEEIKTFPLKASSATPTLKSKILYYPRSALASATATETFFNRIDRNNPRGPANRFINYVLAAGSNGKDKLIREFSKPYQALGKPLDEGKLIESPLIDPLTITEDNPSGSPLANFTAGNVQVMIHNAGNWPQWRTFARGWGRDPVELWQWLQNNSTKAQWDRAQQMGKTIFKPAFEKAQASYERIYGVAPAKIELTPFEIRHPDGTASTYEGYYHPLIPDPAREFFIDAEGKLVSGQSVKQRGGSAYDGPDNFHARTTNGYTKSRTGAIYPVDLNPDMIPVRLTQMLHDIAYREAVINVEKVFRNPGFRNELTKHMGKHYVDGLNPYLQSLAGEMGIPSKAYSDAQRVSEYFRQNVVGTYIGFNPSTPLKHGPTAWGMSMWQAGPGAWARATWDIYARGEAIHDANKAWIDDTFEEVGRRRRFWQDTISGQHADIYGKGTSRERFIEAGSWAVSQSDMFSVRGTALAVYRKELARQEAAGEALDHGLAIDMGNQAVRFAHGSTAATNKPAMVRGGGPLGSWMTSIYGFMGTIMQRRIEIAHVIADQYRLGKDAEFKQAFKKIPDLAGRIVTHVILPIAIEEMVTGLTTDDRRGWGEHIGVALFDGLARSALYVRDIAYSLMGSHAPSAGLMTGPVDDARKVIEDVKHGKKMLDGPRAGKFVGDTMTALGDLTGRSTKTLGALAHFGINYSRGYEHPKTAGDWYRGLARGTTKPRLVKPEF